MENVQYSIESDPSKAIAANKRLADSFNKINGTIGSVKSTAMSLGIVFGAWQIKNIMQDVVKAGIDFESSFAGVRKTVEATAPEFAQLSSELRTLAKEIPVNVSEINKIAEAAGQLGIKKENIVAFTRVMADLGATTNLSFDQAATALARLANVMGTNQKEFDRLGSSIVDLGNKFATTEAEIVDMALRIAGAGKQIGLTEAQVLGFAAALSSVGIESQAGGTAISKVMIEISKQVETSGKHLEQFASVAGMSVDQFKQKFEVDAAGAITAFVAGLGRIDKSGGSTLAVLEQLGIKEIRMRDALLRTSAAGDLLSRSIDTSSDAWKKNTALTEEASKRYSTFESQWKTFKNVINDFAIDLANKVLPQLTQLVSSLRENEESIRTFGKAISVVASTAFKALEAAVNFAMIPLNSMIEWFIAAPGYVNEFRTKLMSMAKDFESFGSGLVDAIKAGIVAKWDAFKGWFSSKLQGIRDMLPHSDAKTGPLSTLTQAGAAFWTTFAGGLMRGEGSLKSALMSGLSVIESTLSQTFSKMFSGLGKMWGGLLGGALATGIMAAVGLAINAIANAFKHDWLEDVERTVSNMLPGLELTEETLKKIAKEAEKAGDAMVGTFLSLRTIMDDVGVSAENVSVLIGELRNGFSLLETGAITSAQLIGVLEDTFDDLATASMDSFGVISAEMQEIIALAEQFGLEIEAITNFMNKQFADAAGALTELIEQWAGALPEDIDLLGTKALLNTRQEATDFMTLIMAQMNEMIARGMSLHEIFSQLGPAINTLRDAAVDLGLKSDPAFKAFFSLFRIMKTEAAGTLANINTLMTSFANLGILNQKTFDSLQRILGDVFTKFNANGKISRAEMIAMLPTLAQMRAMAEQYGLTLDDATQAMIDLAISRGLLPEEMPIDPMVDFANVIRDDLIPAIKEMTAGINAFIASVGGIPSVIGTTVVTTYTSTGAQLGTYSGGGGKFNLAGNTTQSGTFSTTSTRTLQPIVLQVDKRVLAETIVELGDDGTMSTLRTA